jgi:hypothetical protein
VPAPRLPTSDLYPTPCRGRSAAKSFLLGIREIFQGLEFHGTADLVTDGEYVIARLEGVATHAGAAFLDFFIGFFPANSGRKVRLAGTTTLRIKNGKIVEDMTRATWALDHRGCKRPLPSNRQTCPTPTAQRPAACCFPAWSDRKISDIIGNKRYPRRTPKTLTGPTAIIREICMAAKQGYALSDEELELGMRSLAVPVHGADGCVIAAMSVSAFAPRISVDDLIGRFLEILKESAAALEHSVNTG